MSEEFIESYKCHYEKLFTLAFRMTGSREKAEDVLQTSYMNAFKAWDSFRGDSSIYTWLYRIVVNTSKREWKKAQRLPMDLYAEEHHMSREDVYAYVSRNGEFEDDVLTERVRETCLQMFMNCMPTNYRILYVLRVILQLSVSETADTLAISESAVKTGLSRARKILQDHFQGRCSLVHRDGLCRCRAFSQHVRDEKKEQSLYNIRLIKKREKDATSLFHSSLQQLVGIDELYQTTFEPVDFNVLLIRVKESLERGDNPLLAS